MPWVRFDDQFSIHRKVAGLSDAAFRLHVSAIFWCARNLTDGFLPREDLDDVCARVRTPERFAAECLNRRAWHLAGDPCDSPKCPPPVDSDGWRIHDYLEYQPSKAQVTATRAANARRQTRWRDTHNGVSNAVSNAVSNGGANSAPSRPDPDPSLKADVGIQSADRNGRASPDLIELIITEVRERTGRSLSDEWAERTYATIIGDRSIANPAAYLREAIRKEPDPRTRFLPLY